MAENLKILLFGATGRMGQEICLAAERSIGSARELEIQGGIINPGNAMIGKGLPQIKAPLDCCWREEFSGAEVLVDFTGDAGARSALEIAAERRLPMLLASTGLTEETVTRAGEVAKRVPLILTANTSVVVTAMKKLAREAAKMLGDSFDIELVELHHRHKKDAPSGTALMLLREVAAAQGKSIDEVLETGRAGTEALRKTGTLGAQAVRGGDVAGEHTLYFFGEGERLEITQRATNRRVYADGAIRAAFWLREQARRGPGLFSMEDVLN